MKRRIANHSGGQGDNDYLLNIDPSSREVLQIEEQGVSNPEEIYDLGDSANLDQNAERVKVLAAKIQNLANQGGANEISKALSAKVKYND